MAWYELRVYKRAFKVFDLSVGKCCMTECYKHVIG